MVLMRPTFPRGILVALTLMLGALFVAIPASAHENHQQAQVEKEHRARMQAKAMTPGVMQAQMEDHAKAMEEARPPRTLSQRFISWLGRTHPFAVHFPIALFPVALVALVLARRRGETVELIRAIIIVAGAAAAGAAALGWITAGLPSTDPDGLHRWHRWLGTALALIGAGVGLWAWRRRDSVDSPMMLPALGAITLLLMVQGWLGAALVHGMEHMDF